jgi:hypothetical protein
MTAAPALSSAPTISGPNSSNAAWPFWCNSNRSTAFGEFGRRFKNLEGEVFVRKKRIHERGTGEAAADDNDA